MAEPNEIAEAVLIVIKRLAKWLAIGCLGLIALGGIIAGGVYGYDYVTKDYPISKIDMQVSIDSEVCSDPNWPLKVLIGNRSNNTIRRVNFKIEVRMRGRSTDLAKYHTYSSDKVLLHDEGWFQCWENPQESPKDLLADYEFKARITSVYFAD